MSEVEQRAVRDLHKISSFFLIPYSLFGVLTNPLLFLSSYSMFAFPWFKKWEGEM